MGQIQPAAPKVLLIFAAFSSFDDLLDRTPGIIGEHFGPVGLASDRFEFTETDYYAEEMGQPIKKQFFCCSDLFDADFLNEAKIRCNAIEASIAATNQYPVARPLNIDPGYIDGGKLALASTKGPPHRFYIGQGIYVESTLSFRKNVWVEWPWTYRDFKRADYHHFLHAARRYFLERRRSANACGQPSDG